MHSKQAPELSTHRMLDASFDARAASAWRSHRTTAHSLSDRVLGKSIWPAEHILESPANEETREDMFCNFVLCNTEGSIAGLASARIWRETEFLRGAGCVLRAVFVPELIAQVCRCSCDVIVPQLHLIGAPIVPQRERLGAPTVAQVVTASLAFRSGVGHLSVQAFALKEAQEGFSFCVPKVAAFSAVERMAAVVA